MLIFFKGVSDAVIWLVKSVFKICFRGLFGESARALVRATPSDVAIYRLGLGFSLGNDFLDV